MVSLIHSNNNSDHPLITFPEETLNERNEPFLLSGSCRLGNIPLSLEKTFHFDNDFS